MAVILLIQTEDNNVEELPLLNKMILGRSSSADFKVNDQKISSKHCSIELTPKGEVLICDLGSTNGTFLNNAQIHQSLLKINEELRIGNTYIKVDEKKLTMSERVKVGMASKVTHKTDDKTLPEVPDTSIVKKKTMIQEIKKKNKTNLASWGSSNDQLIDQEESSGNTRFLKLDKKKK